MEPLVSRSLRARAGLLAVLLVLLACGAAWAFDPKNPESYLDQKAFFKPELYISSSHAPVGQVLNALPNKASWEGFIAVNKGLVALQGGPAAWVDPRSGAATGLLLAHPLVPGRGVGNSLTLGQLSTSLGRKAARVDASAVADSVLAFVRANRGLLAIDDTQLGAVRAVEVTPELWQVNIPQVYKGVAVRYGRLAATINNGNLVLIGSETWGDVRGLDTKPAITAQKALDLGFEHVGGRSAMDETLRGVALEIIPVAPPELQSGEGFDGPVGAGYRHRLVYSYVFRRPPDEATWELMVDAHSGEVLAFQDVNLYVERQVTGGVYPLTSTGICPNNLTCGIMQSNWPMPFADTGFAAPNNFTNSAGVYDYTSGTATTTLTGRFVDIVDTCGAVSNTSATGAISLGGLNNQHDCTTGGGGAGNTPASRSAFYEVNKLQEQARGWLTTNTWLNSRLTTNVNINQTCNAFWSSAAGTINFYRSGGGCRNTGELAGVFDHEWGHGMDDNDAGGVLSSSSEAYADIAAIYRLQTSCVGHGFFSTADDGCGQTADGTGFNANEAQQGAAHCDLDCSGVRDADYLKHSPNTPDTALGFVCSSCLTGSGPCGRQVHCAAAPTRQAAWDLVARDLRNAPFSLDSQSAFLTGNRLFYLGSGNVGSWHSCTCGSASSGCGATNGYMQWLAADDDNGNVNDGTPHMTAIFNAFNRHGIACATPAAVNSGCAGGPTTAPTLSGSAGNFSNSLSWNAVSGASRYWVFRSEGHAGCDFGKSRIADVTGTSFTDTQVANGRNYFYSVVAQGTSAACYTRVSNCLTLTPAGVVTPDFSVSCSPSSLSVPQTGSTTSTCTVSSVNGFNSAVALSCTGLTAGASCSFSSSSVTPPANGSATSTLTVTTSGAVAGASTFTVQGVSGALTRTAGLTLNVQPPGATTVFFDNFETSLGWTRNLNGTDTATTGLWERADPQATTDGGTTKQQGTTVSGTFDLVTGPLAGATAGVHDIDAGVTTITSPAITLPSSGTITLSFASYLAHSTNSSSADFLRVQVVGSTTSQVFQELGAANDDPAAFATTSVNISSFAGQTIRIRIEAADASTASLVEAAVDDVRITVQ
jgi:trimeric autotransporter adhesin